MDYCYSYRMKKPFRRMYLPLKQIILTINIIVLFLLIILVHADAKGHFNLLQNFSPIHITGTVTDSAKGNPLRGVSIRVKGTATGTTTDANGRFSLEVSDNAILVISYLGYNTREISTSGKTTLNIQLSVSHSTLN